MAKTHILGLPRIGAQRELKKALEAYWAGKTTQEELLKAGKQIRIENWKLQSSAGFDLITVGDFSFYDHILDTSILLGAIPKRFEHDFTQNVSLDEMFRMARGQILGLKDVQALAMTKWFNTNYHYLVPEFTSKQEFTLCGNKLFSEVIEAQELGYKVKPVLVGPLTYLWLGKEKEADFDKLNLLPNLIEAYNQILFKLNELNVEFIQIDEPILTLELSLKWQNAFSEAYTQLQFKQIKPILTTYFGDLADNLKIAKGLPIHGLHIDICSAPNQLVTVANELNKDKVLSIGIIDGRNIWKNDLIKSLNALKQLQTKFGENLWISSSCSLLHCPVDLDNETKINPEIKSWLAFSKQKISELATLSQGINISEKVIAPSLADNQAALKNKQSSSLIHNPQVNEKVKAITAQTAKRHSTFDKRIKVQLESLNLPLFPTTTIGSFPQTDTIRKIRREFKNGKITQAEYTKQIQAEIQTAIQRQENIGIDLLVHGEAERNDMVEYFGEQLAGFVFTENGWVQSYGSRCVKPPIIYGDISRPQPMTVEWTTYAQSLTNKKVKGMLTGPVTILSWSFVRNDQPHKETALQIALALRDEVLDLEKSGINIIQIDEPAFREALPLKKKDWQQYLDWAVHAFRISSSGVKDNTQIHTHMCYSSFNDIIQAIADLDADVITIETSRSDLELLNAFESFNYPNQIGPGVYDIHSPRIPDTEEIVNQVEKMLTYIPAHKLWINPDCGLKTRNWVEVEPALHNMHQAANILRSKYQ